MTRLSVKGGVGGLLGMLLLFYGCGAFLEGRRAWFGLGLAMALGMAISLATSGVLAAVFGDVAFVLLPFIVGRSRRLATAREHAARDQAERLDQSASCTCVQRRSGSASGSPERSTM